jgi:DNA-binding XRE family transcriptional regulator
MTADGLRTIRNGDVGEAAITMAIGIVIERISQLSAEDKQDLFELVKGLESAECDEDIEAIRSGMLEILDQDQYEIRQFEPPSDEIPPGMVKWNQFVADKVRALREAANKTQTELARDAGLTQSHISRIENAELSPSHHTVEKLAAALGVQPGEIDPTR